MCDLGLQQVYAQNLEMECGIVSQNEHKNVVFSAEVTKDRGVAKEEHGQNRSRVSKVLQLPWFPQHPWQLIRLGLPPGGNNPAARIAVAAKLPEAISLPLLSGPRITSGPAAEPQIKVDFSGVPVTLSASVPVLRQNSQSSAEPNTIVSLAAACFTVEVVSL
jgi:hypothetical protein